MSSAGSSGGSNLSNAAGQFAAEALVSALPPQVQDLLKPGKTPQRINQAINWAARRDPAVLTAHRKHGNKVATFEDIRTVQLDRMDHVARHFARLYRRRAGLTGAVTGLPGGLWAVVAAGADVQLTAIYAVRMAADIAQSYGYDTTDTEEQAHLAEVLALAAGIDSLRGIGNWLTREGLMHVLPDILPKILVKLSVQLTEEQAAKWVGRIIPGVGAAVGGAIDYSFLKAAGDRAMKYYHNRYLVDHGMAPREILGEPVPALAPPPGTTVEGSLAPAGQQAQLAAARPPLGQQISLPAPTTKAVKPRRSAPERFAIWLGIWAMIFLVITVGACAALIIIVANFVSSHT